MFLQAAMGYALLLLMIAGFAVISFLVMILKFFGSYIINLDDPTWVELIQFLFLSILKSMLINAVIFGLIIAFLYNNIDLTYS